LLLVVCASAQSGGAERKAPAEKKALEQSAPTDARKAVADPQRSGTLSDGAVQQEETARPQLNAASQTFGTQSEARRKAQIVEAEKAQAPVPASLAPETDPTPPNE
jgi:hypothetical protein